jgi:hypothetical protein
LPDRRDRLGIGRLRDKPDYHVHNRPQAGTGAGTQNADGVSPEGNTFPAATHAVTTSMASPGRSGQASVHYWDTDIRDIGQNYPSRRLLTRSDGMHVLIQHGAMRHNPV